MVSVLATLQAIVLQLLCPTVHSNANLVKVHCYSSVFGCAPVEYISLCHSVADG